MKKLLKFLVLSTVLLSLLTACAQNNTTPTTIELSEVVEAIKEELGEDYYPNREMTFEEIQDFTGLSKDAIEVFIGEAPMMSIGVDTLIAIKATPGNGPTVYEGLEKYRTYLVEESFQYPMNMAKVNAAKAVQYGDYAFFIMLGGYNDAIEDSESDEAREFAEAEVAKVQEVISGFFNQ
jgi:hypothetical protein